MSWFGVKKRLNFRCWRKNWTQFRWRPFFFLFVFETTCFWAEKTSEFSILAEKSDSISVKTFFFFWDHLFLGGKKVWTSELSEKFRLHFRTNRVKLIQNQWKFGSRSFALFSLFQKSPPPFPNPGYAPGSGPLKIGWQKLNWRGPGPLDQYYCWRPISIGGYLNNIVGAHLNWFANIELKRPRPPQSVLFWGALLNWGRIRYYCRGPI